MRRLSSLALALSLFGASTALAGDEHENWLRADALDLGEASLELKSCIAQETQINLDFKVSNVTADYIFVKKHELVIKAGDQSLKPFDGKEKPAVLIDPNGKKSIPLKVTGAGLHVEAVTLTTSGFYKASGSGTPLKLDDFQLPPSNNNVEVGPFKCAVTSHSQATKITTTKWSCTYSGQGVGYVDASKIGVKIATGTEFANTARTNKPAMLSPGETATFVTTFEIEKRIIDMQFATMQLQWREALAEAPIEALDAQDWELELDAAITADKNK